MEAILLGLSFASWWLLYRGDAIGLMHSALTGQDGIRKKGYEACLPLRFQAHEMELCHMTSDVTCGMVVA